MEGRFLGGRPVGALYHPARRYGRPAHREPPGRPTRPDTSPPACRGAGRRHRATLDTGKRSNDRAGHARCPDHLALPSAARFRSALRRAAGRPGRRLPWRRSWTRRPAAAAALSSRRQAIADRSRRRSWRPNQTWPSSTYGCHRTTGSTVSRQPSRSATPTRIPECSYCRSTWNRGT